MVSNMLYMYLCVDSNMNDSILDSTLCRGRL